ncbi:TraB/GumN family protein [Alteriqipengyuania sp. 357]
MFRAAILALVACLTAACGQPDQQRQGEGDAANPLLWEIARADGDGEDEGEGEGTVEGWLLGTIHALPDGADWRGPAIDRAVAEADVLAVEIADVADPKAMSSVFMALAFSAGQPPLTARVPADQREQLAGLVDETSYRLEDFGHIESWGAALILSQAVRNNNARTSNGIDRALIRDFGRRQVVELEGARAQFEAFDGLSEPAQRAMLTAIVEESEADEAATMRPIKLYLAGDADGLDQLSREGMLGTAEIREALLTRRNAEWVPRIETLLAADARPLVAVGAAHMVGDDGLVALLRAKGYRVTRLR